MFVVQKIRRKFAKETLATEYSHDIYVYKKTCHIKIINQKIYEKVVIQKQKVQKFGQYYT